MIKHGILLGPVPELVIAQCAAEFGVYIQQITKNPRVKGISRARIARCAAAWIMYNCTNMTLEQVAKTLRLVTPSGVSYLLRRIDYYRSADAEVSKSIRRIIARLKEHCGVEWGKRIAPLVGKLENGMLR